MTLQKIIQFLGVLITQGFTGQIRLNFHEGNLSEKIEKKESCFLE